jgi:alkanesulfonate monooxygenase SsuD/methylene tetrahydromethanopterin reductase-like flavin-dependent oxidoreductase (luciferase family)
MQFNFFHLMPYPDYPEPPNSWPVNNSAFSPERGKELYDTYIDTMAYAESCGFDWVGCNEHHFSPYGLMSNCNLIGAVLANRTRTIRLAMLGNLVPLLNPVRVAEEYAMLDVMSGGRLIAGFMRGIPHEYIAYNIPPDESRARQREAAQLIIKCWTEPEPFGWEGEFFQYPSISFWPKPLQKPHPPILVSAANEESAVFAAECRAMMGMVMLADFERARASIDLYKKTANAAGWEPGPEHILIGAHTVIAETDAEARDHFARAFQYFYGTLMRPQGTAQRLVLQKTRYFQDKQIGERFINRQATIRARTPDEMIDAGTILVGSPETVVQQIKRMKDELGHGCMNINMQVGNVPPPVVRRGMELFRDRVLPHVHNL